ncbi:hypothetical protein Patl1_14827 [Pistacia atlantica]|uniref:Uncharacterized protein n=1 Tax=Pistacia atlantica TaxID=434234 RepID=A0ACC1ATM5_9ROSI|nr:hypothetical protein Patl1_14827 [Pistacia atlantica]
MVASTSSSISSNFSCQASRSIDTALSSLRIREDAIANGVLPSTIGRSN